MDRQEWNPSEIEIEAGAERGEGAVVVVDELEGRLHGYGLCELSFPGEFQRVFIALLELGVLSRHAALVLRVQIGAAYLCIAVAGVLAA